MATTPFPQEEIAKVEDSSSSGNPLFLLPRIREVDAEELKTTLWKWIRKKGYNRRIEQLSFKK